ncbi:MAG: alpha-glucan family phosphorylase [Candidatus Delongbacteria bacterium]|nr:alpha-glucan family phosphorylase [Candidatus Delongbacteria bacterium]
MKILHKFQVVPHIPERLSALLKLAYNIWYTWHPDCVALFHRLDRDLWDKVNHNPVKLLGLISQDKLNERLDDEGFLNHLERVSSEFDKYMQNKKPYQFHLDKPIDFKIAYLSAEYGLTEALPIYSGGLGVLSGDHLKSASDLNVPIVAVGLLYQQGYFQQYLNEDGWQQEVYTENDFANMPIKPVKRDDGTQAMFDLWIKDHYVKVRIWLVQVGKVDLLMLDTNFELNHHHDRLLTSQLYGGDKEMRLRQEILLGIGGVIALRVLGIEPVVYHMNEGHSAFASLERIRDLMERFHLNFQEARQVVTASNVFTTHTPVPAGNDVFHADLMSAYFKDYVVKLGISMHDLLELGREQAGAEFCMTVLAIRLSAFTNGVSQLHKHVSRKMWQKLWKDVPLNDIPIHGITNGIHIPSWISADMANLFDRYLGRRWAEDPDNEKVWLRVDSIPDSELWRTHERRRERLVDFARRRLKAQLIKKGASHSQLENTLDVLNPQALTIGFARRFATYKRAVMIFRDLDRLSKILNDPDRPVQIIFAGKAHPQDSAGKEFIQKIVHTSNLPEFKNKIVFIENYDMNVARYLVEGVDIWLNNPRRPLEACGTSGMKAAANGALNLSIKDGWWDEGYNNQNGWAIGFGEEYQDTEYQDRVESNAIYQLLENEIVPLFYNINPNSNLPREWIRYMKNSMRSLCTYFNSHRMVEEYLERAYYEGVFCWKLLTQSEMAGIHSLNEWLHQINNHWHKLKLEELVFPDRNEFEVTDEITVKARIRLSEISPESVEVDLYYGMLDTKGMFLYRELVSMRNTQTLDDGSYWFEGSIRPEQSGDFGCTVRIMPRHPYLLNAYHLNKIFWG